MTCRVKMRDQLFDTIHGIRRNQTLFREDVFQLFKILFGKTLCLGNFDYYFILLRIANAAPAVTIYVD